MKKIMIFPIYNEYTKTKNKLDALVLQYTVLQPPEGSGFVPAIVFEQDTFVELVKHASSDFIFSGCIDFRQNTLVNASTENIASENILGDVYIMHITQCVADDTKLRFVAHLSKEIAHIFPYVNSEMKSAFYTPSAETLTFMENHRLISLYNNKIAISKTDDINDVWRLLIKIRQLVNSIYENKDNITPSYVAKKKPPALIILKQLPGISCGKCGHKSCMSFALALWGGTAKPMECTPIFDGSYKHLQQSYLEMCAPFL